MRDDIPPATRLAVLERDRHRCRWCGRMNVALHIHHITYRSAMGKHTLDNLITLCYDHHDLAHSNKGYYPEILRLLLEEENLGKTGLQLCRWMARVQRETK